MRLPGDGLAHAQGFLCQAGFTLAWSPALCHMAAVAQARPEVHLYQRETEGEGQGPAMEDTQETGDQPFLREAAWYYGRSRIFRMKRDPG